VEVLRFIAVEAVEEDRPNLRQLLANKEKHDRTKLPSTAKSGDDPASQIALAKYSHHGEILASILRLTRRRANHDAPDKHHSRDSVAENDVEINNPSGLNQQNVASAGLRAEEGSLAQV
jgi:hypothetical protein